MFDCAPLRLASPMRVSSWGIGSARARVGAGFDPSGVSDRISAVLDAWRPQAVWRGFRRCILNYDEGWYFGRVF